MDWTFIFLLAVFSFESYSTIYVQLMGDSQNITEKVHVAKHVEHESRIVKQCKEVHLPDGSRTLKLCENGKPEISTVTSEPTTPQSLEVLQHSTPKYESVTHNVTSGDVLNNSDHNTNPSILKPLSTQPPVIQNISFSELPTSEVVDLKSHEVYAGGSDVDEIGVGSHKESKSKEEEKLERESLKTNEKSDMLNQQTDVADKVPKGATQTSVIAIATGICLTLSVGGFLVIVIWRRFLRRRYGNREELVNEDDDLAENNDADMHHFEASTIRIEQ